MLKVDDKIFPEMPMRMKERIKNHLDFADEILEVKKIEMEGVLGKPLHFEVVYKWKGVTKKTSFTRKGYTKIYG